MEAVSGDIRRLDYVDRFASIPVSVKENVSTHSYWVALYSVIVHRTLSGEPELVAPISVKALVHDAVECVTGDFVRTFKYSSVELREAIERAEKKIEQKFPLEIRSLYEVPIPTGQEKYVKACIKLADFIALFQYLNREVNRGNTEISSFVLRMQMDMKMMADKAAADDEPRIREMAGMYSMMSYLSFARRVAKCDGDDPVLTFQTKGE